MYKYAIPLAFVPIWAELIAVTTRSHQSALYGNTSEL